MNRVIKNFLRFGPGLRCIGRFLVTPHTHKPKLFEIFFKLILSTTLTCLLSHCVSNQEIKRKDQKGVGASPNLPEKPDVGSEAPGLPELQTLQLTAWFAAPSKYATQNADIVSLIHKAKLLRVTKIYVSVWGQGCTSFPSKAMINNGALERCPGFDWLTPMKNAAKSEGVTLIPWLEWGLHVPKDSPLYTKGKLTIIESQTKAAIENWQGMNAPRLNPFFPNTSAFFSDLIIEAAEHFEAKEVQICDNHALKMSQLKALGKSPSDFTLSFLAMLAKPKEKGIVISLAALEHIAANSEYGINWPDWRSQGIVSDVISELYHFRTNPDGFAAKAAEEVASGANQLGVYVGGAGGWSDEQIYSFASVAKSLKVGLALFEIGNFVGKKSDQEILDFSKRINK